MKLGPSFSETHTGYNHIIYYETAGGRYEEAFTVAIDDAPLVGSDLIVSFSASENPDVSGLALPDIAPNLYVAAYGYDI